MRTTARFLGRLSASTLSLMTHSTGAAATGAPVVVVGAVVLDLVFHVGIRSVQSPGDGVAIDFRSCQPSLKRAILHRASSLAASCFDVLKARRDTALTVG